MFHRPGKKVGSLHAKSLKELTRIVPAPLLLAEEKRNVLLSQIREACALEDARYDSLCLSLLHNLVNHVQNLPETSNSYYSQPGGLLDYALNRTEAALELFHQYVVQEGTEGLSEEQKLWQYVLFSAALLKGIGKLQIDYSVDLYDSNGQFLKQWNPVLENMVSLGGHYLYEFQKESDEAFRCRLNLLLARLLMPGSGFAWIAANLHALGIFLALLNEDYEGAGTLGAILIRADAIAKRRYFNQMLLRTGGSRGNRYGRVGTFAGVPESIADIEQQIGVEFIQWLAKSLETGLIQINKAPLWMVPDGFIITKELLHLFQLHHPEYKNWQALQKGVLALGLHSVASDGGVSARYEQNNNQQMHNGIVLADYAVVLPAEVKVHNLHTGKSTTMSAIELIHQAQFNHYFTRQQAPMTPTPLSHLTVDGKWEVPKVAASYTTSMRPGILSGA